MPHNRTPSDLHPQELNYISVKNASTHKLPLSIVMKAWLVCGVSYFVFSLMNLILAYTMHFVMLEALLDLSVFIMSAVLWLVVFFMIIAWERHYSESLDTLHLNKPTDLQNFSWLKCFPCLNFKKTSQQSDNLYYQQGDTDVPVL